MVVPLRPTISVSNARFTLADLMSSAYAEFSPTNLSNLVLGWEGGSGLYEDSAGTTPVDAALDPIGHWAGQGATGVNATQSTTANKPTAETRNSRLVPGFSGDRLGFTSTDLGTAHTIFAVIRPATLGDDMVLAGATGVQYPLYIINSTALSYYAAVDAQLNFTHSMTVGNTYIVEVVRSGTSVEVLVNGASLGVGTLGANTPMAVRSIGAYPNGSAPYVGSIHDVWAYTTNHSSGDRLSMRRHLASLNGITL